MGRRSCSLKRMAMPSWVARKMTCSPSVMLGGDELVVLVDADGDDAAGHDVGEVLEGGLLDGAVAGGEEDVLVVFVEVADGEDGDDFFAGLEVDERGHGLALAGGADVGDFVDLEPVDAAGVGEAEQVGVGASR